MGIPSARPAPYRCPSRRSLLRGAAAGMVAAALPGAASAAPPPDPTAPPPPQPRRLWRVAVPQVAGLAAADGQVYAAAPPHLHAVDARTGAARWAAAVAGGRQQVVAGDGCVAVRAEPGVGPPAEELAVHEAGTGAVVWSAERCPERIAGLDGGGLLLYQTGPSWVRRVDLTDGRQRWLVQAGAEFTSRVPGGVVAADARGTSRLDSATGAPQWTVRPGAFAVEALSADGAWLTGCGDLGGPPFAVRRVSARTGAQAWAVAAPRGTRVRIADAGEVVAVCEPGRIVGRDAATGESRWEVAAASVGDVLGCGGLVWVVSWHRVLVLDAATGAEVAVPGLPAAGCGVAETGGVVVVAGRDDLVAFDTGYRRRRAGT
ncbi:MAG TPA: PQQ-binding-like beta-propeller repeat protein [Pilimelia sp.]|nr:PQQ-binding-like beta-propeller repeat protein [Pilimelia sp.]